MMNKNHFAIIMAGGIGSRFWPVSTPEFPKQFHDMLKEGQSFLQSTFKRISFFVPKENILILTNKKYKQLVRKQLPDISDNQIIYEPLMRNTAPCILYASLKIKSKNPKASILVAPCDHHIREGDNFITDIISCLNYCEHTNSIITLGIKPNMPHTGYGYIESEISESEFKEVISFKEKPNKENAKRFVKQSNYLWNLGIFIFGVKTILNAFEIHQSKMYTLFNKPIYNTEKENSFIKENYGRSENISIDYAIIEKANNILVKEASFLWNDLGTWKSLYDQSSKDNQNNAILAKETNLQETNNNIIYTDGCKKIIVKGLSNYIVVDRDDTLLIWPLENEQEIKKLSQ